MELLNEEGLDERFDLKPILPEICASLLPISNANTTHAYGVHVSTRPDTNQVSNSSYAQEITRAKPSPSAASVPLLISFQSLNPTHNPAHGDTAYSSNLESAKNCSLTPQILNFSSSVIEDSGDDQYKNAGNGIGHKRVCTVTRTPLQAQDHLVADRKRREKLGQLFISPSKVVPGLKKLEKASPLEDATNYLKSLQERMSTPEEEGTKKIRCMEYASKDDDDDIDTDISMYDKRTMELAPPTEIKAKISNRHALIKNCCKKQMGLTSRIPCEMEKVNLNVTDMRIMPFGGAALGITVLAEVCVYNFARTKIDK